MKPMNQNDGIPEVDPEIPENAVRLYGESDAMDDFPVLKAFQQYIDAEQSKARKRMLILCVFFGVLMTVVIAVFLALLLNVSSRNQSLNDRLVEYAMKERERMSSPIVVQQPQQPSDSSAILALTTKIEDLQKKLDANRAKEEAQQRQAEIEAAKPKGPTPEELEIKRLNALLAAEKEKRAAEKAKMDAERERQRQIELEEYRRKHYPELYEKRVQDDDELEYDQPQEKRSPSRKARPKQDRDAAHKDLLREIDEILSDGDAITYYDEDDDVPKKKKSSAPRSPAPQKEYSIPVDIRGSSSRWSIPNE